MQSRTAKSCGPDAPTLASSLAEVFSALPGSEKTLIRRRRWQKSPVTKSTTYAVKTIAQGMPGVPGYLWLLALCFLHCTGGCGCSGHPAFPAPSVFRGPCLQTTRARTRAETVDVRPGGFPQMLHRIPARHCLLCRNYRFWRGPAHAPIRPPGLISPAPCRYLIPTTDRERASPWAHCKASRSWT